VNWSLAAIARETWARLYAYSTESSRAAWTGLERGPRMRAQVLEQLCRRRVFKPGQAEPWAEDPDDRPEGGSTAS
jgi:hypothetical protein